MKRRGRSTSAAQFLLFPSAQPARGVVRDQERPATTAGLGRPEARQLREELTAQLARKFGVGWETRSDLENARIAEALERKRAAR